MSDHSRLETEVAWRKKSLACARVRATKRRCAYGTTGDQGPIAMISARGGPLSKLRPQRAKVTTRTPDRAKTISERESGRMIAP